MWVICLFFFSSRRRHTRYWRDWSSDVCSSDLTGLMRMVHCTNPNGAGVVAHVQRPPGQIGRASCRERVLLLVVVLSLKKKCGFDQCKKHILSYCNSKEIDT